MLPASKIQNPKLLHNLMAKLRLLPDIMRTVETPGNCEVHSPGYPQGTDTSAAALVPAKEPTALRGTGSEPCCLPTPVLLPPPHSLGLSTPVVTPTDHLCNGLLIFSHDFPGRQGKTHSAIVTG